MLFFGKNNRQDINLIPEEEQILRKKKNFRLLLGFAVLVFSVVALTLVAIFILLLSEKSKAKDVQVKTETELLNWQKVASAAASLNKVSQRYNSYKSFSLAQSKLELKLEKLAKKLPNKVQLLNLFVDNSGKAKIAGKAASADVAYQLLQIFQSQSDFASVSLSALTKGQSNDVTFSLDLVIH
ncbi:MAG: hypothetical protein Q8P13_01785 [bacterium]|nr:hypothetical protein [bacterium]